MNKHVVIKNEHQNAVIYARYSSHSQKDVAIEQQIRECERFAQRNGLRIVGTYEDHALTGTNANRPGFQRMIQDAEACGWSYVIVYSLDRFSRNRYDSAVYKRQLKNYGVKVLSAMENISDDPSGVLMESLLEGLAEYYSKELSQKIRRGMNDNASKCLVNGSLPLGYVRGQDGHYAIDEDEAAIVREIYQRVRAGEQIVSIVQDLNKRGIKTKTGKLWNKSSFNRLLSNERYTGVYIYGETRIPGGIPSIVSQELFDSVQYTIATKKNPRSAVPARRRRENGIYLLTGKLYCGTCKAPMVGVSGRSKSGNPYFYYVCKNKREAHSCNKRNVPRDWIEQRITEALKETMFDDTTICALADAAVAYQSQSTVNNDVALLQSQLQETEKALSNIMAAIEAGIFTATTRDRMLELENKKRLLSGQLAIAQEEANDVIDRDQIVAYLMMYRNGDTTDKAYQEALIDAFLVAVYVYDNQIKFVFRVNGEDTTVPFDIDEVLPDDMTDVVDVSDSDTPTSLPSKNLYKGKLSPP